MKELKILWTCFPCLSNDVTLLRNPNQTRQPMTIFSSHVFEFFLITRYHKMTRVNYVL